MPDATVHGQQVEEGTPEGDVQRPTATPQVAEVLKKLAQRIRTFAEGIFPPSPPPALLDRITDELLVLSSDVVAGVARDGQAISANAALRLLAWTVADARGATVALDGPLALTVGKRLDRQAQSVRAGHARAEAGRAHRCLFDGGERRLAHHRSHTPQAASPATQPPAYPLEPLTLALPPLSTPPVARGRPISRDRRRAWPRSWSPSWPIHRDAQGGVQGF